MGLLLGLGGTLRCILGPRRGVAYLLGGSGASCLALLLIVLPPSAPEAKNASSGRRVILTQVPGLRCMQELKPCSWNYATSRQSNPTITIRATMIRRSMPFYVAVPVARVRGGEDAGVPGPDRQTLPNTPASGRGRHAVARGSSRIGLPPAARRTGAPPAKCHATPARSPLRYACNSRCGVWPAPAGSVRLPGSPGLWPCR